MTERDRRVLDLVAEHKVLTTDHLAGLLFPSRSRAQHRLLELARMGVLFRTQPFRADGGSKPFHYLLGYRGAELLAAQEWSQPPRPSVHAHRIRRALGSPTLDHLLGTNGFFADLAAHARRTATANGEGLRVWHSEQWVRDNDPAPIRPDGYGLWVQAGRALGFYLEYDTGSEPLHQVADKMHAYHQHTDRAWTPRLMSGMLLFSVASRDREAGVRRALRDRHAPIPVATTHRKLESPQGPAGEVWSVLTAEPGQARRVRLGDLPLLIGGTEAYGAPTVLARLPEPVPEYPEDWVDPAEAQAAEELEADATTEPDTKTVEFTPTTDDGSPSQPPASPGPRRGRHRWWLGAG